MSEAYSAGVRPTRIEWVEETTEGVTPSDPEWELYSDNIRQMWDWEPDANMQTQRGVGTINPQGFFNGSETHEAGVTYDLQRWYVDGSGNTVDAGGDFIEPDADNSVKATHSVVEREEHSSGGTAGGGRRLYVVAKGGKPDTLTAPFETEEGGPIQQELTYQFEKIRPYDISQPSGSTTLDVESTDAGDTTQTLTIEDEGAGTTEDVSLNGTTTVTTTATFDDIDAAELDTETVGDVTISDGSGNTLLTIQGSDSYPAGEGDLGVPALGSGSHASELGTDYIRFIDDTLSIPNLDVNSNDYEIISGELTVETGLGDNSQTGTARRNIHAEAFSYTISASLAGTAIAHTQVSNYLTEAEGTITWTADEGSIDANNARIESPGTTTKESGNGKMTMDNEFTATDLTVSN